MAEIVGVATLPAARRRGLAAAVTAALVADAIGRGVVTVFLSADSDAVARIYERVGVCAHGIDRSRGEARMNAHAGRGMAWLLGDEDEVNVLRSFD